MDLSKEKIVQLLKTDNFKPYQNQANSILIKHCSDKVYYRGLLEFSNICSYDCKYCGIRKSNTVNRYELSIKEIIYTAKWCADTGYGSIVLQSGERNDKKFILFVENALKEIKRNTISERLPEGLGITLCVGEQTTDTYKRFFSAGAHRYLLRIETSSEKLFNKIHTHGQDFAHRKKCLEDLKKIGFQVGTGVMIGLPEQTEEDLADDLIYFKKMDIDMIGMGPFIPHKDTPFKDKIIDNKKSLELSLRMISIARMLLYDVNIAATSALQTLHPRGREIGLEYGANIIMPLVTPKKYRESYLLYDGKPCIDENPEDCSICLQKRINGINRKIGIDEFGDSKHFFKRKNHDNISRA